jgi:hypothetical protein
MFHMLPPLTPPLASAQLAVVPVLVSRLILWDRTLGPHLDLSLPVEMLCGLHRSGGGAATARGCTRAWGIWLAMALRAVAVAWLMSMGQFPSG